ncbi:MAG: leucyl aminopeptidase [Crocinitomicaceae bacterium]|jgi:leucyl aminopeptidase
MLIELINFTSHNCTYIMKIINNGNFGGCSNRIIVGSKAEKPTGLNEADNSLFDKFIEGDEDVATNSDFVNTTVFVKHDENAEKMRVRGAKARAAFKTQATQIAILGSKGNCFDLTEGLLLSNYQFNKYFKDKEKKDNKLAEVIVEASFSAGDCDELESIYKAVSWARTMVNEPVSFLNADQLAAEISVLADSTDLKVTVLEKTQIESLKMGGLLAVNQGSIDQPTFTIAEYKPENATNKKPIVLVGKGVVYDTGGLSLKPTANSMDIMKSDMGGAACMAGAIYLAAMQKLPLHIIALIPATDNRPGLNAYAPGDVVTMYDGTTVEVLNTDAEGRMILADALAYSKKFDPEIVIDAATLTGAAVRAIGNMGSCVMGNADDRYFTQIEAAGNGAFERTVRFPFWDEYGEEMKSPIADLKNLGGPNAGMITAGKFLEHFVEAPYIHIDLAGPAWLDKTDAYRTKGGTGAGVRLMYHFFKNFS